ncbi:MAG TPA: hypothetical protein VMC02_14395 [Steroidobacteraceae bacterium]|nr:hypothetical protein [Steroidobacteraceae bacterium]
MNLSLRDAFARFGAKPANRLHALSAVADDGALVLNCISRYFGRPCRGVLRYEDKVSRQSPGSRETTLLAQHLKLAQQGVLPVRLVVSTCADEKQGGGRLSCHIRPDLIGKVAQFDGDHFVVDFTCPQAAAPESARRRK